MVEVANIRERYAAGTVSLGRITDYVVQAMQAFAMGTIGTATPPPLPTSRKGR